ncbi:MAG: serine/threonine protein kinase [Clostridiales Family XIII bacterium]|jgi:serine/threonine-protein kinase|nr:serine/threonine protein kinase [Clostridiales Family XIII bacterium]
MAEIGEILEGKYEILKQIGKGGMSRVYLAMDRRLNKQWAVKEIQRSGRDSEMGEVVINSAITEANLIKTFDHYHIPHINDIIEQERYIYVVMDYVEGESLLKILQSEGAQSQDTVIRWGRQLTDALHYLHTRKPPIVYRDMKPSNVMIKPDGDVKLIDFGIARQYKEKNIADTMVLGTVGYAPPEQFGGGQTDVRADIYALGATLYHAVTGHGPKKGEAYIIEPIRKWNPALSGGFEKILLKCTKQKPEERYQNTSELMYDLQHYREVDDAFLAAQRKKLKRFFVLFAIAVVSLATAVAGHFISDHLRNADYDRMIDLAIAAEGHSEKLSYYGRAIELRPTEAPAYEGLATLIRDDSVVTAEEKDALQTVVNRNISALKAQPFFADFAYEIGEIYTSDPAYGGAAEGAETDQATRMKEAMSWFGYAKDLGSEKYANLAGMYYEIGNFYKEIGKAYSEGKDPGKYLEQFGRIAQMQDALETDPSARAIDKMTLCSITIDFVSYYADGLKLDEVRQEELEEAVDRSVAAAKAAIDEIEAANGSVGKRLVGIKEQIDKKAKAAKQEVERVYRDEYY